ncbi:MAG: LysE family transporter [Caldilineales bacterium]|nr:LysE family transporter [Caldilineales bacterium]
MMIAWFWRGLVLGFAIAAPVGPIGLLCIRRTLNQGRGSGLASGLGAASADAFYGSVAAFGLAFVADFLTAQQMALRLVGGIFLIWVGVRAARARPTVLGAASVMARPRRAQLAADFASTFLFTLTNPLTILSFTLVFAGLGLAAGSGAYSEAAGLVAGVFSGSALWWLLLSTVVGLWRRRIRPQHLHLLNVGAGAMIALFGLVILAGLLPD